VIFKLFSFLCNSL